jgi:transposase-like protein
MRVYSREFRIEVVRRILAGEKVPALAQELGIHRKLLYEWLHRVNEGGESNLRERGRPRKRDGAAQLPDGGSGRMAELERTVAHQQVVIEFLREALQANKELAPEEKREWRYGVFQIIEKMMRHAGLSVEMMCELAQVDRSGYYRYLRTERAKTLSRREGTS